MTLTSNTKSTLLRPRRGRCDARCKSHSGLRRLIGPLRKVTHPLTLTNSFVGANDRLVLNHTFGGSNLGSYMLNTASGAGFANIQVRNVNVAALSEPIVTGFAVIKAVII